MAAKAKSDTTEALKQLTYLASALKAPRITEAAGRLADHARDAGWTHEEYLAAVLDREVAARNASGAQLRIRAAGFGSRKTIEEFDWDAQPAVRQQIAALASGGFLTEAATSSCSARPAPAKPTWPQAWASPPPTTATGCCSRPPPSGSPGSPTPTAPDDYPKSSPGCGATG